MASTQLDEAIQRTRLAREQVAAQRKEATRQEKVLREAKKKLPSTTSARSLRQQLGGLAGRAKRQEITKIEKAIGKQQVGVGQFQKELTKFEVEQLKPAEAQVRKAKIEKAAFESAEKLIEKGLVGSYLAFVKTRDFEGDKREETARTREILKRFEKERKLTRESEREFANILERVQTVGVDKLTALEKRRFDTGLKTGAIAFDGKLSGELNKIKSLKDYKAYVGSIEAPKEITTVSALDAKQISVPTQQVLTVEARQKPAGFLEGLQFQLGESIARREAESLREDPKGITVARLGREAKTVLQEFGGLALGTALGVKSLIKKPRETVTTVIGGVKETGRKVVTGEGFPEVGMSLRAEPTAFFAGFALESAAGLGTGKAFALGSKTISKGITKLSPKYRPVVSGAIRDIPSAVNGKVDIEFAGPVSKIAEPIREQVLLAGETVDAVSAQRGLFKRFKPRVTVEKPLPTPDAPQLERAFFADPRGRLRVSRLGLEAPKAGGILDYLSGDISIGAKPKPQALLFEQVPIEKFPRALIDVKRKLEKGVPLSPSESQRLLEWQLKPSGKFKPVGFLSKEPEVTLAPGEIIAKEKTLAKTIIKGETVPVISTKIKQASKETLELLKKAQAGELTESELIKLSKKLTKETGIDYSGIVGSKKYISKSFISGATLSLAPTSGPTQLKPLSLFGASAPTAGVSSSLFGISGEPSGAISAPVVGVPSRPLSATGEPSSFFGVSGEPSGVSGISPVVRIGSPSLGYSGVPSPSATPKKKKLKELIKEAKKTNRQGYDTYQIKKGSAVKVTSNLVREDALNVGAKEVLKTLAATFFIKKSTKKNSARDIKDNNEFNRHKNLFRAPKASSKYKGLGEEVWIQKKHSVAGSGGRLSFFGEKREIKQSPRNNKFKSSSLFGKGNRKWL